MNKKYVTDEAMSHYFPSLFLGLNVVVMHLNVHIQQMFSKSEMSGSIQLKDCGLNCSFLEIAIKVYLNFLKKRDFWYIS